MLWHNQQMDVIGHDDKIADVVPFSIPRKNFISQDRYAALPLQVAIADSTIEIILHFAIEFLLVLKLILCGQARYGSQGVLAIEVRRREPRRNPAAPVVFPSPSDMNWNRVAEPKCYKVRRAVLSPVWHRPLVDAHSAMFIKRRKKRTNHFVVRTLVRRA
jgi:hypothetical protein